ncbi:MAG: signal recognition particle-docking protein FtsY [Methanobacteriaceae archaeon]|nr:signal recognition particle-docking protein FtsY [Methanobacteriaceae archaeon]
MFDSLKKKFAEASGKLRNKVEEDAKKEDNIELIEEKAESLDNSSDLADIDDDSILDDLGLDEDDLKDLMDDELDDDLDDAELESEDSNLDDELESDDSEEVDESKSKFLSFFRRNKSESEEESVVEDIEESEDIVESEDSEDIDVSEDSDDESSSRMSSLFRRSKDKDDSDEESKSGGFLSFIREKTISEDDVEDILFELELGLLEADVAMEVASTIVDSLKEDLVGQKIKRSSDIDEFVFNALKKVVAEIIDIEGPSMTEMLEEKVAQGEPLIVMLIGINGTGKTTTIGKLCNYYLKKGYTPVIAAADTFRAGAIEQIGHHADNLGVKLIKHEKGSDPAAVAFDAVQHAKAKGKELVLIDTAGRMQTNVNLMDEMKKIRRVSKPDLVVFVGDALTGNDATEQARKFKESIDIDGVILTKADADSKGGASLSIGYVIKKPILFLGMGQSYDDIKEYDADWMLEQIFS